MRSRGLLYGPSALSLNKIKREFIVSGPVPGPGAELA